MRSIFGDRLRVLLPVAAILAVAGIAAPPAFGQRERPTLDDAALAQDQEAIRRGRAAWQDKASCGYCHGWAGDGQGDPRAEVMGSNLRETQLDANQLYETIQCGRPATGMPHHDRLAYSDGRCFGLTSADLGADQPPPGVAFLQRREIESVVAYILAEIKERGPITLAECEAYFSVGSVACEPYR